MGFWHPEKISSFLARYPGSTSQAAVELDPKTGKIVWQSPKFEQDVATPVRDANRLPNGNTLVTGSTEIIEVSPKGEIVWRLKLQGVSLQNLADGFYKADRIGAQE
ncbi:MAG: hypothetical protein MUO19_09070 [Dehalococcoidales bacterium]|nr:hypothetical protein [Dehalococcoidales bacterium]